ncbi:hypothetical protein [Microcoleus sp. CAWBG58]|nr:hypothetical protein [Microcoleus sp. CAWBG58]
MYRVRCARVHQSDRIDWRSPPDRENPLFFDRLSPARRLKIVLRRSI